jgi:hypothetical protein
MILSLSLSLLLLKKNDILKKVDLNAIYKGGGGKQK